MLTLSGSLAGLSQKTVDYTVTKADVYLSGAKVSSLSNVQLEAGTHSVLIKNITNSLVDESMQVKVSNGSTLVSVNVSRNYLDQGELTKKEKELYETQKNLVNQLQLLNIDKAIIQEEHELILVLIQKDTRDDKTTHYTVSDLQDLSKFYATKISEFKKATYRIEQEIKKAEEELKKINDQLREEKSVKNKNNQQVELIIHVAVPGMVSIELSYFVSNCGWIPQYDIKADNKDNPIEISYKGSVWQSTGVDWNQTEITLMTNQPAQDQNRPVLSPVYVDIAAPYEPLQDKRSKIMSERRVDAVQMNMLEMAMDVEEDVVYPAVITATDINIVYKLAGKHVITGNGKPKVLILDTKKIPSRFVYHCVPKLNEQVYLLAYIPNWHNLNLINGIADIYLQDVFIGHIAISETFTGSEYPLSFGVDNRISIKRNRKQDFSSESRISSEKKEKISYEFTLRNNLQTDIAVEVLDQIPISKNKSVKVVLEDKGDAEYTEAIGLLKWVLAVPAGKSSTATFAYELRYPKENALNYTTY